MTSLRLAGIPALLFVALVGCADDTSKAPSELVTAREQFSASMDGSYIFTWRRSCECTAETAGPIRITVQAGQIIQAIHLSTEEPVSSDVLAGLKTIEGVFDTIEDAYNDGAASIHVTYDASLQYPASVGIDYDLGIADEELSLQITDVVTFDAT